MPISSLGLVEDMLCFVLNDDYPHYWMITDDYCDLQLLNLISTLTVTIIARLKS